MHTGKLINHLFLRLSTLPMPGHRIRPLLVKWGGVRIKDYKSVFIGEDVLFDTVIPENIIIERGVRITAKTAILTHFLNPRTRKYDKGEVHLCEKCFLGLGTMIVKPVTIGRGSVVGAGSVVTKDVPDGEIWAGNPARKIGEI